MGSITEDVKKLGFGLMRLPKQGEEIDIEQTKVMVDKFLQAGFNYFDTAWAYAGSEDAIRQALVERYPRDSFYLATKNAAWIKCETREEAIAQLETSLKQTGAGYFDFYLLHNLGQTRTEVFEKFDLWSWGLEMKEKGLIRHLGFSAHATADELDAILTAHPEAEFVQLQINYADWESESVQSRKCYEVARKYGKPVIIMEPVKGGLLATPPESVQDIFRRAEPDKSVASWAVRYAADLEGVLVVLSGMSSVEQMEDNLSYMKDFTGLTDSERETVREAQKALAAIPLIPCTSCDYCAKVCPMDVRISGSFSALNLLTLYGNRERAVGTLNGPRYRDRKPASACVKCGACEEACPQHISIREELEKAVAAFEQE